MADREMLKQPTSIKSVLIFVMHQFIGMWGPGMVAYFLGTSVYEDLDLFHWYPSTRYLYRILSGNPYYLAQIVVGLGLGWSLGRRFQQRSMVWVWVIPLMILCYAVISFTPEWTSVLAGPSTSRLSHYFGWEGTIRGHCRDSHCMDQLVITMPFYAAVAYSIGGWFGLKHPKQEPSKAEEKIAGQGNGRHGQVVQ
jgi:hypothetical protein